MSKMSDLDLMVREGERTAEDFEARGFDPETAEAMADIVARLTDEPEPGTTREDFYADFRQGVETVDLRDTSPEV